MASTVPNVLTLGLAPQANIIPSLATAFTNTLPLLLLWYGLRDQNSDFRQSRNSQNYQKNVVEEYDFIIVGGGSAGSVLANRLSSKGGGGGGNFKILLLENGGNPNPIQSIPATYTPMLKVPQVLYDYYTVPQNNSCLALKEQRSYWPRGKGLGGTSNLNSMIYQRCNRHDYDKWAELSGSDDWKFDNILRNFKNVEDYHGVYYNEIWHSQDGQGLYVSTANNTHLLDEFLEAGKEIGYEHRDVNGDQEPSFGRLDFSIKNGRRFGTYPAFLKPVMTRPNLIIYRYSRVTKIHLTEKTKRAYGVTYIRHGVKRFVRAKREIIISAGAIDSAKLLQLSGIGPKEHLDSLGIKCLIDLPVGQNLQDHVTSIIGPFTIETPGKTMMLSRDASIRSVLDFISENKGIMTTPSGSNGIAYIHSSLSRQRGNVTSKSPDIQIVLAPSQIVPGKYSSRGEIRLASADPMAKPILDPKYFSHPDDIKILVDGLKFAVNLAETTKAFRKLGTRLINRPFPGCEKFKLRSDQYYECYARHMTLTEYHLCGTCSMGKGQEDPNAVVDSKLRVLHARGLRVVDASIFPEVPNGNTHAAVLMVADRASEYILDYWARVDNSIRRKRAHRS
ncbi:unnamed protein product [Orchesella dallaii]|uniref:Glucose dehydrogenase [FAD, quinone] n=1 Tax=Orchesella dallaii TaxID=48710 RepID=A0ABP1QN44_9HEXA